MIPSEVMGQYLDPDIEEERTRRRSAPLPSTPRPPGLYPLSEEGMYGAPPVWSKPELYKRRPRKPKVYASYAISSDCNVHAEKLETNEKGRHSSGRKPSIQRKSSAPPLGRHSASTRETRRSMSASPEPTRAPSRMSFNSDTSGYESTVSYESLQYVTSSTATANRSNRRGKNSTSCRQLQFPEVVREEQEEEEALSFSSPWLDSKGPTSWDSMGVLGLSSKLFSETKTQQESNFLGQDFLRKTSFGTHVC